MGVKFQNKNQNEPEDCLLCAYVLIKKNLPIDIHVTFMYEDLICMKLDRLYLVLSEWGELTAATLL